MTEIKINATARGLSQGTYGNRHREVARLETDPNARGNFFSAPVVVEAALLAGISEGDAVEVVIRKAPPAAAKK